ncbi:MAG: citrate (Si)-synthase, partial [Planctomycetota bacterium]|nr:citrate (Si)-synthase [Planctomycetota bacterium]
MKRDAVTITDHRTNLEYEIPVVEGAISAMELRKIKVNPEDFGLLTYDPGFTNTAACRSRITYIDGDEGILRYRGYPIEELAEKSTFLEVAYLLLDGELPDADELAKWRQDVADQAHLPAELRKVLGGFPRDGHPMGIVIGCLAALATHHPDARDVSSADGRRLQILRILGKMPLVSAYAFRHTKGQAPFDPDPSLSYTGRFLQMVFGEEGGAYRADPVLERALDVLFIL